MRAPVNSLSADLRRTAQESREAKAADLYAPDVLRERMQQAAGEGFDSVTIHGPDRIDLSGTAAAKTAAAWLVEMKIAAKWESRTGSAGADAAGTVDLVLSWKPSPLAS